MSIEKVREYFKKYNIEDRIQEFEESSATVELAAKALKCEPKRIYLDKSLKRFETVYPACGSANSAIELSIEELEKYSNYISWVDACKF